MATLPTNAAWLAALRALEITGVTRHYDYPPASVSVTDLPCAFPLLQTSGRGARVSTCVDQSKTRAISFVVVIEPVAQDTQANNYDKLAAAMDNLETALDTLAPTTVNFVEYSIDASGDYRIGGTSYWALIASITGTIL